MHSMIHSGPKLHEFSHGERFAAFMHKDGRASIGKAVVDSSRVDRAPNCYFQGGGRHPRPDEVAAWCLLGKDGAGPEETWPVWHDASEHPMQGDIIVYWDTLKCRQCYSGPYWHVGTFGTENYRFQGAAGPFVSGEPWSLVKSWTKLDDLVAWLGLSS